MAAETGDDFINDIIIACQTLRDELKLAIRETGCQTPVIWIDSDYHNDPNQLRDRLQQEIDSLTGRENILLAYGCCGTGLVGLKATGGNLIIPKTEDCISMVLGRPGEEFARLKQTYFLTKGWIEGAKSIFVEYDHALKRYGPIRTKRLFEVMLKHYRYLMLIDTGAYDFDYCYSKTEELAQKIGLEPAVSKGDTWHLKKLLTGPHDKDFCVIPPGGSVELSHFGLVQKVAVRQLV